MKIEDTLCYSHLMSMMLQPKLMEEALFSLEFKAPSVDAEGFNGYMETKVTFHVKDLLVFSNLYSSSYKLPSNRSEWYCNVRDGILK